MKLWIANCTKQRQVVFYRLDFNAEGVRNERSPPRSISIEGGRQAYIDLKHVNQLQPILDQLSKVGARGVDEKNRLPPHTVPYMLSADVQVPTKVVLAVNAHNKGVLERGARQRRQNAAIAASDVVQKAVDSTVQQFSAEIEQMPPEPGEPEPKVKPVAEGFIVETKTEGKGRGRGKNS